MKDAKSFKIHGYNNFHIIFTCDSIEEQMLYYEVMHSNAPVGHVLYKLDDVCKKVACTDHHMFVLAQLHCTMTVNSTVSTKSKPRYVS